MFPGYVYDILIALGGDGTLEAVLRSRSTGRRGWASYSPVPRTISPKAWGSRSTWRKPAIDRLQAYLQTGCWEGKSKKGKKPYFIELADGKLSEIKDVAMNLLHQEPDLEVFLRPDNESKIRLSRNFRDRYPDLRVRACIRKLSPSNPTPSHGRGWRT
jgi:hypothetical protein